MFEEFKPDEVSILKKASPGTLQELPSDERVSHFKTLWAMFKQGTDWINEEYKTHLLPDGRRHFDPQLETQIKLFEDEVMKPLDLLWREMCQEERDACGPLTLQPAEDPLNPTS